SRSSVSIALNNLAEKNLIEHEQYGHVILTAKGRRIANNLERRHQAIKYFLAEILGISADIADEDACKMEHIMSQESLNALYQFLDYYRKTAKR
ncbi:metal-dependent transcriptional regulator, partial [candidate division KSB1 bacterium]|nr:metal-dependent transcriptional regulator [candidate division KSB1 bacterium]